MGAHAGGARRLQAVVAQTAVIGSTCCPSWYLARVKNYIRPYVTPFHHARTKNLDASSETFSRRTTSVCVSSDDEESVGSTSGFVVASGIVCLVRALLRYQTAFVRWASNAWSPPPPSQSRVGLCGFCTAASSRDNVYVNLRGARSGGKQLF